MTRADIFMHASVFGVTGLVISCSSVPVILAAYFIRFQQKRFRG